MDRLFNKRVLYIIPAIFFIVILLRIVYAYSDVQQRKYDFALKEAEVLNSYALTHRTYYQKLFVNKTLPLNADTLLALPAYSSYTISKTFSQSNKLDIILKTVSDKARNLKNKADIAELEAIDYFKKNSKKEKYFSDKNEQFYQFAYVLKIDNKCLKCHGKKENAPLFIQKKYDTAYDYKLGEVRGIQSIKIPKNAVDNYFIQNFMYSIIYDLILFISLFFAIFLLIKKSKTINHYLETQIYHKTTELKNTLIMDRLTALPNRLQLIEDIKKAKGDKSIHLALLNVDRFKEINDFYGYTSGDIVLQEISKIIKSIFTNQNSFIYKLPSDEFGLLNINDISQEEFVSEIKNVINTVQESKIQIEKNTISVSLSSGIASNEESLLHSADMALQSSKSKNNNIIIYSKNINNTKAIQKNIEGIEIIKDAIKRDSIIPYFQPIFNVHTQKIEKYESLVRIIKKDGEVLSPFSFLDIAIKSRLYPNITKIMIKKSFEFFKYKKYEFSLNLSINDITNKNTKQFIVNELEKFPDPKRVVFEILESDKMESYEEVKNFIKDIKKFGCKFAIDDFGSGYSNFAHVLELNVDYLKIDSSLVKYITTDENSRVITKTIINFASTLGLKTIAEFVEDKDSLEMLHKMGVDYIQGYYIGKPDVGLNTTY